MSAPAVDAQQRPSAPQHPPGSAAGPGKAGKHMPNDVVLYHHSGILYWWPVWLYGGVCAFATWLGGKKFAISDKELYIYENALLGISFALLLLFVVLITNLKARGVYSVLTVIGLGALMLALHYSYGMGKLWDDAARLRVHMNLAFYIVIAAPLLVAWVLMLFVFDRSSHYRFTAGGQLVRQRARWLGGRQDIIATQNIQVRRLDSDFFLHGMLGLGSGDIDVAYTTTGQGREHIVIENVLSANKKIREILGILNRA